jgi:hypothetical protein
VAGAAVLRFLLSRLKNTFLLLASGAEELKVYVGNHVCEKTLNVMCIRGSLSGFRS